VIFILRKKTPIFGPIISIAFEAADAYVAFDGINNYFD
jgi:hypothetical protein